MKLVNGYTLLEYARKNSYILPAFNTTNYELSKGIIEALQESKIGGIIQISSSNLEISSPDFIVSMVNFLMEDATYPVTLHLDHAKSFKDVKKCVDSGFTSVMIDSSHLPFEQNIKEVQQAVKYCHYFNIPVEAELGSISGKEEDRILGGEGKTNPDKVREFVEETNCDLLAVSVGNVHGLDIQPNLDLQLLENISKESSVPLVLHGGSGIPYDQIREAKKSNLIKVNFGADLRKQFIRTFGQEYEKNKNAFDVKSLSIRATENVKKKALEIMYEINK
ncbi:class II aldolase [Aerococcus mictus]|uniref:class II aldolase n=1 Tax=Aerococcus mictus TaxID=2976810 RepID=UPI000DCE7F97|nr:class II aldolase [Aerococcus mictus]KAA9233756.1 class II aldolase [Aerococcus mictus]MDL5183867.1 class II aldolase [Aerococcus mictus]